RSERVLPVIAITMSTTAGWMILETAGLSFLGLGAQPLQADLGSMLGGRQGSAFHSAGRFDCSGCDDLPDRHQPEPPWRWRSRRSRPAPALRCPDASGAADRGGAEPQPPRKSST